MAAHVRTKRQKTSHKVDNQPYTQFENLSNDIVLEIVDYLDEKDVQRAFHSLNQRFSELIDHYSGRSVSLSFLRTDSSKIEQYCHELILPNKNRIRSLKFKWVGRVRTVLSQCALNESFAHLESISLYESDLRDSVTLLHTLPLLPRLKALQIKSDLSVLRNNDLGDIYSIALRCFHLTFLAVENSSRTTDARSFERLNISTEQSNIEVLKCLHSVQLQQCQSLLEKTPKLRCLQVSQVQSFPNSTTELFVAPELNQLSTLSIGCHCRWLDLQASRKVIAGLGVTTRSLKLIFSVLKFIKDAAEWNKLLNENLPQLDKFKIELRDEGSDLFGLGNDFRQFSMNLFMLTRWDAEPWSITFDAHMLRECAIVFELRK